MAKSPSACASILAPHEPVPTTARQETRPADQPEHPNTEHQHRTTSPPSAPHAQSACSCSCNNLVSGAGHDVDDCLRAGLPDSPDDWSEREQCSLDVVRSAVWAGRPALGSAYVARRHGSAPRSGPRPTGRGHAGSPPPRRRAGSLSSTGSVERPGGHTVGLVDDRQGPLRKRQLLDQVVVARQMVETGDQQRPIVKRVAQFRAHLEPVEPGVGGDEAARPGHRRRLNRWPGLARPLGSTIPPSAMNSSFAAAWYSGIQRWAWLLIERPSAPRIRCQGTAQSAPRRHPVDGSAVG